MAFGSPGFGSLAGAWGGGQQIGGPVGFARMRDPRYAYAQALLNNGTSTAPVGGLVEGAARAGQALTGAWLMRGANEFYEGEEKGRAAALAKALREMHGTPAVTRTQGEDQSMYGGPGAGEKVVTTSAVAPNIQAAMATLGGNKYTADMAAQFQLSSLAAQQAAEAQAAAQANAPYSLAPGAVRFGPGGRQIAAAPAIPEKPQTVNTAEGVFIVNRDGTLGHRLGGPSSLVTMNLPPSGYTPVDPNKPAAGMTHIPGGPADPATIAARAAAEQSAKPDAALQKAKTDYQTARDEAVVIVNALQDFKDTANNAGLGERVASVANQNTGLNTAYNKAALMAKGEQLFALGVLNGPDLDIIRRTLPDPSTLGGAMAQRDTVNKSVRQVIDLIQDRVNAKAGTAKETPTNLIEYGRSLRSQGAQEYDYDPATKTLKPRAK